MSKVMDEEFRRWTAKRKAAFVTDFIQGKISVAEASRPFDIPPSEIEEGVDEAKRGIENTLRAKPLVIREQYERQLKALQVTYGEAMLELRAIKNAGLPAGRGREMIETIRQELAQDGFKVSVSKICQWFAMPRCTAYYKPV